MSGFMMYLITKYVEASPAPNGAAGCPAQRTRNHTQKAEGWQARRIGGTLHFKKWRLGPKTALSWAALAGSQGYHYGKRNHVPTRRQAAAQTRLPGPRYRVHQTLPRQSPRLLRRQGLVYRHRARLVSRRLLRGARPAHGALDRDAAHLLPRKRQTRVLHVARIPDRPHPSEQPHQHRFRGRVRRGAARYQSRSRGDPQARTRRGELV